MADILANISPPQKTVTGMRIGGKHDIIGNSDAELVPQLLCHGIPLKLEHLRAAAANYLFDFTPAIDILIQRNIVALGLPEHFIAVHIRGGDKLVSEWSGPYSSLGKPQLWADAIVDAAKHEKEFYRSSSPHNVFIESDDCSLLMEVTARIMARGLIVAHLPCTVPAPVLYTQRGRSKNISGHHQWSL